MKELVWIGEYHALSTLSETSGADGITTRLDQWLSNIPKHVVKSITFEQRKKFSGCRKLYNKHIFYIFFTDSGIYCQWGLNEHYRRLLRRDRLPKQIGFNKFKEEEIQLIAAFRNKIPRNFLDYLRPIEALHPLLREPASEILT